MPSSRVPAHAACGLVGEDTWRMTLTFTVSCSLFLSRDAITKMKDVYLKNPQMGDPASLDHKLTEVSQNIEKLRLETQKFEV